VAGVPTKLPLVWGAPNQFGFQKGISTETAVFLLPVIPPVDLIAEERNRIKIDYQKSRSQEYLLFPGRKLRNSRGKQPSRSGTGEGSHGQGRLDQLSDT